MQCCGALPWSASCARGKAPRPPSKRAWRAEKEKDVSGACREHTRLVQVLLEADSILIDEARTPLIISGPAEAASDRYVKAAKIAEAFALDVHYSSRRRRRFLA